MTFPKNAWYAAAWADEVTRSPMGRRLLDQPIVLYRTEKGVAIAVSGICPHRFAPMHKGIVHGDVLACPYHGLQFAADGSCHHNPHGELIPPALRLDSFPVVERDEIIWLWPGKPELADPDTIPAFSVHSDPAYLTVKGVLPIAGSYELVSDNLLDLSHTQYLHPALTPTDDAGGIVEYDLSQDDDMLTTVYNLREISPTPFIRLNWPDAPDIVDNLSGIRWQAPAAMLLKVHMESRSPADNRSMKSWGAHLVTPETSTSCHYFWSFARDYRREDQAFSEELRATIEWVFTNEDGRMIADVQANMGDITDLIALRPVILPTDSPSIRARSIVRKLIKREMEGA